VWVGAPVAQEPELVLREPPQEPAGCRLQRVAHARLTPGNRRGRELRLALDRTNRSADEEGRRVDRPVVGEPPDAVRLDVADLVRDSPRLLLAQSIELATLHACEVKHRRLQQPRKEIADDQRDGERVAAEDHLEQAECGLAGILLGHARTNGGPVQTDLLGPLDAGQFAELLERVRHRLRIPQIEHLDRLEPLAREQLHRRTKAVRSQQSEPIAWTPSVTRRSRR
jgi:hypothetical protein